MGDGWGKIRNIETCRNDTSQLSSAQTISLTSNEFMACTLPHTNCLTLSIPFIFFEFISFRFSKKTFISLCVSVSLSLCLSVSLSQCLSVSLYFYLSVFLLVFYSNTYFFHFILSNFICLFFYPPFNLCCKYGKRERGRQVIWTHFLLTCLFLHLYVCLWVCVCLSFSPFVCVCVRGFKIIWLHVLRWFTASRLTV